ncbi:MAG: cbb3-type cytochrome c oxidase N-terminal domain-containing protein [Phycisphaerae bacterium]
MKVDFPEENPSQDDIGTTGHEYDGIREYDNPTPGWWVALFVGSIFFAAGYGLYYHAPVPDRSIYDQYEANVATDLKKRFAGMGELKPTEQAMLKWMAKPDYLAIGKATFKQNCVSCHGSEGQGLVGPNMTDDYYKNIHQLTDFPRVITSGAANGAMPPWGNRLHPNEIALVATYVATLRGQNLPGRPPEGEKAPPWPQPVSTAPAPAGGN